MLRCRRCHHFTPLSDVRPAEVKILGQSDDELSGDTPPYCGSVLRAGRMLRLFQE